jgi:hypothetical protein
MLYATLLAGGTAGWYAVWRNIPSTVEIIGRRTHHKDLCMRIIRAAYIALLLLVGLVMSSCREERTSVAALSLDEPLSEGYDVQALPDGGYVLLGWAYPDFLLVRTDAEGNRLWLGACWGNWWTWSARVRLCPDGGFIVISNVWGGSSENFYPKLSRFSPRGWHEWERTFRSSFLTAWDVEPMDDGGYLIATGTPIDSHGHRAGVLLRTDSRGDTLWSYRWTPSPVDEFRDIVRRSADRFLLGGDLRGYSAYAEISDTAHGPVSERSAGSPGSTGLAVAATTDGGCVVVGQELTDSRSFYVVKHNATRHQVWERRFDGPRDTTGSVLYQEARDVVATDDGGVVVVGKLRSNSSGADAWIVRLGSAGDSLWSVSYGTDSLWSEATGIDPTPDGGYIVAGTCMEDFPRRGLQHAFLLRLTAAGDTLWSRRY